MDEDYGTFSAAVDHVVTRAGRAPLRDDIASLVRQVIRTNQTLSTFAQDRAETSPPLAATSTPFQWRIPPNFRSIELARVTNRTGRGGEPLLFKHASPGNIGFSPSILGNAERTYYRGGDIVVFGGHRTTDLIGVSYFTYLPPLHDFGPEIADRPWRYDILEQQWVDQRASFGTLTDGSPDPRTDSPREHSTNWLLFNWFELIVKGAMSGILNATNDERGPRIFAEYSALQIALKRGEIS